jgi:predicted Zn-dependent peptidase
LLTDYYVSYGDWRKLFTSIDDIDKVTAEDVRRVARKYFVTNSRTLAFEFQPAANAVPPAAAAQSGEKQ